MEILYEVKLSIPANHSEIFDFLTPIPKWGINITSIKT